MSEAEDNTDLWWLGGAAVASMAATWRGLEGEALQALACGGMVIWFLEQWRVRIRR